MNAFLDCLDSAIRKEHGDRIPAHFDAGRLRIPSLHLAVSCHEVESPDNQVHIHTLMEFGGGKTQTLEACFFALQPNGLEQCAHRWVIQILPVFASLCCGQERFGATYMAEEGNSLIPGACGFLSPLWTIGDATTDLSEAPFFAALPRPHPAANGDIVLAKAVVDTRGGHWSLTNELNNHENFFEVDPWNIGVPVPKKFSMSILFALYFFPAEFPALAARKSGA